MPFDLGRLTPDSSYDEVAQAIISEARRRNYAPVPPLATAIQESGLNPRAVNPAGPWIGIYQQDASYPGRYNPATNIAEFFNRLDAKRGGPGWSSNLWENIFWLQQGPNWPSAAHAVQVGRRGYLTEIQSKTDEAVRLVAKYTGGDVSDVGPWTGDPIWLEEVLRADLGDRLVVHDGWEGRGTGAGESGTNQMGPIWGVMIHHTGNPNESVANIRDGVDQGPPFGWLPGPLSQCLITPDGKCHLVAVGPCNHAGPGSYPGVPYGTGNTRLIGFECAYRDGPWPDAQIITMRDASAAVVRRLGQRGDRVIGHKEYATAPPNVKVDPGNLDMNWFRGEVNKDLDGFVFPGEAPAVPNPPNPPTTTAEPLTAVEQREVLEKVRYLFDQAGPGYDLWGPDGDLGRNTEGQRYTARAGLAALIRRVERLEELLIVNGVITEEGTDSA